MELMNGLYSELMNGLYSLKLMKGFNERELYSWS